MKYFVNQFIPSDSLVNNEQFFIEEQKNLMGTTKNIFVWILIFTLSLLGYISLAYWTDRSNFYQLFGIYAGLYILFVIAFRMLKAKEEPNISKNNGINNGPSNPNNGLLNFSLRAFEWATIGGIVFRIALLFAVPNLSDDFYRFYWDGQLLTQGISPFAFTPHEWATQNNMGNMPELQGINFELFNKLNSPKYFTIYPPVCQFVFWISALLCPNNIFNAVVVMKCFMLLFEIGSIVLLIKLLKHCKLPIYLSLLYTLNPLVIVELTGNIHFEAGMIFFTLLAIYLLAKNWWKSSAVAMSLAVCTKLLPLMFLPFLLRRLVAKNGLKTNINRWLRPIVYYGIVGILTVILFIPILDIATIQNLMNSVDLYFKKFEFNASIFYIVRSIGYQVKGWNIIQTAGPILGIVTFVGILLMMVFEKRLTIRSLINIILLSLSLYLFMATIVHPWYVAPLVALCIFTNWRFPIVWAGLVPLTYFTYRTTAYTENLWLVAIEYGIVFAFIVYELICQNNQKKGFDSVCQLEEFCIFNGRAIQEE